MAGLIQNVVEMIRLFTEVALNDPLSPLLLLFGALFVGIPVVVMGYLALGAVVDFVIPEGAGRAPPQRG